MIDLSILIASYEARDALRDCLRSIERACVAHPALRIETLIVDNGSRDGSARVALDSPLSPRLIASASNQGFAAAINRAWRMSGGRHVLLLNSDVELDADALSLGVELLDAASDIGVVGAALRHSDGRPQRSVHALPGWATEILPELLLRRLRPHGFDLAQGSFEAEGSARAEGSVSKSEGSAVRDVEAVRGAVFFVRGDLAEKVGRLDEGYFFFLEETDYCRRVRRAGFRVVHSAGIRAIHRLGISSKARAPLATRIEFHRSLYRYLNREGGLALRRTAQAIRTFRSLGSLLLLAPLALVSEDARGRFSERFGLVLWHLRGCPPEPALGKVLRERVVAGPKDFS